MSDDATREPGRDRALRAAIVAAAREFNAGRYFEAHEVLEESLDEVPESAWSLVLGLIQVAVGYHKLGQGLLPGAARMLAIGLDKLAPYDGRDVEVDLESLRERARADLAALRSHAIDATALAARPPRLVPRPRRDASGRARKPD